MGERAVTAACAAALMAVGIAFAPAPAFAKFGKPVTLSKASSVTSQVATNARGDTIVVWRFIGTDADHPDAIEARFRPAGGDFGPIEPIRVATPDSHGLLDPKVAIDGEGNAVIVWANANQNSGQESVIEASIRWANGTHDFEVLSGGVVKAGTCGIGGNPNVAVNAKGDAIVAFDGAYVPCGDPTVIGLNLAQISLGSTAAGFDKNPKTMNGDGTTARDTQAVIDASGNWLTVWDSVPNSGYDLQLVARGSDSKRPKALTGWTTGMSAPQIGMDGVGNATIMWSYQISSDQTWIEAQSRSAGGKWGNAKRLAVVAPGDVAISMAIDSNATDAQGNPAAGNAMFAWLSNDGSGNRRVEARMRPAGGKLRSLDILSAVEDLAELRTAIAGGHSVVAWTNRPAGTIQAVTGSAIGEFTEPPQNLSPDGQPSDSPAAAIDRDGKAVVVWRNLTNGIRIQGATSRAP